MKKNSSLSFIGNVLLALFISSLLWTASLHSMKRRAEGEADETLAPVYKLPNIEAEKSTASASASASTSHSHIRAHRFARATLDTAFKHMLMDDEDRSPLISFLTAFTGINITSVSHMPTALPVLRGDTEEKQTFLDLACRDDKGNYFLVEVQVKEQDFWKPRALYYAAGVYSQQLASGAPWALLKAVISLNILDHDRGTLPPGHFKRDFQLLDREHLSDLKEGIDRRDPAQIPYLRIIQ